MSDLTEVELLEYVEGSSSKQIETTTGGEEQTAGIFANLK